MSTPKVFREGQAVARGASGTPGAWQAAGGDAPDKIKAVVGANVVGVKIVKMDHAEQVVFQGGPFWRVAYEVSYGNGESIGFTAISKTVEIDLRLH